MVDGGGGGGGDLVCIEEETVQKKRGDNGLKFCWAMSMCNCAIINKQEL